MTVAEFAAVRPLLNISEDRIEAARAALVEGRTLKDVGDQYNWTRQAVNDSVNVAWRTLESYREAKCAEINASIGSLSPGWEQVTLLAPHDLIAKFRDEILAISPPPVNTVRKGGKKR